MSPTLPSTSVIDRQYRHPEDKKTQSPTITYLG
ncbi:hypothetical protein FOWG_18079 [Fusarium oxysporum f. sp. lycopersici MN25]|nr:hypothetical protein FOWG_18079 [Fusarium oxysporum f. sp. lycopersici MN25]